jgi:hypothetical protein
MAEEEGEQFEEKGGIGAYHRAVKFASKIMPDRFFFSNRSSRGTFQSILERHIQSRVCEPRERDDFFEFSLRRWFGQ